MHPNPSPSFFRLLTDTATSTSTSTSTPSIGISSQDANNELQLANIANLDDNALSAHHDLFLPPPVAPSSYPCAACKNQRRKCGPQCMMAPYFPPDRKQDFENVHRLYGIANITNKLQQLQPADRQRAANSLIFEANLHAKDPVGGCYKQILNIQRKLSELQEELNFVRTQLSYHLKNHANSDSTLQEQPYAHQPSLSYQLLEDANLTQNNVQNHAQEQQFHDFLGLSGNRTGEKSDNNEDIGSRHMMCDYLHNFHNQNEVDHEAGPSEPRLIAESDREGGEHPVCKWC